MNEIATGKSIEVSGGSLEGFVVSEVVTETAIGWTELYKEVQHTNYVLDNIFVIILLLLIYRAVKKINFKGVRYGKDN